VANDICCVMKVECFTEKKANKIAALADEEGDGENFDFNKLIPLGENEYPVDKWGTKWFKDASCELVDDTELLCCFTTAWVPPFKFAQDFCKKFKVTARLKYYDIDDFGANCGYFEIDKNGDIDDEDHYRSIEDGGLDFIADEWGEEEVEFMGYKKDENGEWHYEDEDEK